jgi:hypothetical protein
MGKLTLLLILVFLSFSTYGQSFLKGNILETNKVPIVSASVILKDNTGRIITYTYTDELGKYSLKIEKTGQFVLTATSMGFEQQIIDILIVDKSETKLVNFVLSTKFTELKEILIESKKPITIKNDTIIFNADSFKQGNEQTVEDLLKKIPGLNIDANGTIKVGNQEIEKVMIDGDDMFEKGYKILTKNMPVQPIDQVQLLKNYSNNKL